MNEVEFRSWLNNAGISRKVQGDLISRIKKIERVFGNCDIDEEYAKDSCAFLLSLFRNKGINEDMEKYRETNLPIGKYHLSAYKYSLQKYILFLDSISTN